MRTGNAFSKIFKALVVKIVSLDLLPLTYLQLGRWIDDSFAMCSSSHGPHKRQQLVFSYVRAIKQKNRLAQVANVYLSVWKT
jgi:hypothetical protein